MARKRTEVSSAPSQSTAKQKNDWYQKNINNYAVAEQAIKELRDVTKSTTKTINTFNKESLRGYFQNIGSNEKNLRNLSRYLYYRSHTYYRLVNFYAGMFCLDARSVVPEYDLTKEPDTTKMLKSYYETLKILECMNLQQEFTKIYTRCFIEDVFYGCVYYDETGMFILPIDPDYCKINGMFFDGGYSFKMDMTYFRSRKDVLEMLGEPFDSMYRAYNGNNANRWQPMPEEYCLCLKFRADDYETVIPPLVASFNSFANLIDLEDIQAIADEQQIYKMVWLEMETLNGTKSPDDWKVNPNLMMKYFNRMLEEAFPEYVTGAIVPGKLNTINFNNDQATDTNRITKATEAVLNTTGGAEVLNGATIKNAAAFTSAAKANTSFAISTLLPQTQAWLNRFLKIQLKNASKVKFFPVSIYTKDDFKKSLLESSQYGFSNKLAYNTLNGISEMDSLALNYLEETVLNLSEKLKPLQSSHTASGKDATTSATTKRGRPQKDEGEISEEGERSRDKK